MKEKSWTEQLRKYQWIVEIFLYIFVAECVFGGSGRWLVLGGVSIRIALFGLCFILTLPYVLMKWRELLRIPCIPITILFGVTVLGAACLGIKNGNATGFVWADVTSFLTLALLPGIMAVIDQREKFETLLKVMFVAAFFVALVTVIFHFGLAWMSGDMINAANDGINEKNLGGFALLGTYRIYRVYFRAQIFLQFAFLYGMWKIQNVSQIYKKIVLYFAEAVIAFAIIASYTRGFWLGLLASMILVLLLERKYCIKLLASAGVIILLTLAIALGSVICYRGPYVFIEVVNRFDPNLVVLTVEEKPEVPLEEDTKQEGSSEEVTEETTQFHHQWDVAPKEGESTDAVAQANENAVNLRQDSLNELNETVRNHPLLGSGLGKNLDGIRSDGKTEYMYQDIILKMGLVGFLVFLITYMHSAVLYLIKRMRSGMESTETREKLLCSSFLVSAYLGVAVTSAFNPFLTAPMGICMLIIVHISVNNDY